ncbi:metal ABC transporter solute-binding protein, Zn/Mn family [Sneathia sanguinegens]|uniref:metal ABC transporter solute-binding protein, Zn/Mn family n=1 Tax=Sneathia sanguinegens TaxID=40543 RepID=UPI0023F7A53C|nr:zinc ABC transporter substrate-binding protein [Sneathia sanguinegens]MDU4652125.1 zinc ABC transporter substrate-binding protein [Sneathia sanguinegens]MDU7496908.1 zinc ABC transporter substrate-binding protein [Sneathia sanguinegens]
MKKFLVYLFMLISFTSFSKLRVGITMLPYYCFVSNIVGDKMDVVPLVPANVNAHTYDATAQDVKKLTSVNVVVANGVGHDMFLKSMLKAAHKNIPVINANSRTTLMRVAGQRNGNVVNPHTFISVTQSIQQVNYIAQELGKIDRKNAGYYRQNALRYSAKLRAIKAEALRKVRGKSRNIKIATTHGGYDYLLNEFGLSVSAVVEPSYVQSPSLADAKLAIKKMKQRGVRLLFDEKVSNHKLANVIYRETGVYVANLNHMTNGSYRKEAFEKALLENMNTVANAILKVSK